MNILHCSWLGQTLHLWAERKTEEADYSAKRRGRKPAIPASPFDAGITALCQVGESLPIALSLEPEGVRKHIAWLPSIDGAPAASSPLIAETADKRKPLTIAPWRVTTLPLAWPAARDLLCTCLNNDLLAPGILAGTDLRWWAQIFRLAAHLAARGSFLPGIRASGKTFLARWEPVLDASIQKTLDNVSRRMPDAVRCLSRDAAHPPRTTPKIPARDFLSWSLDCLVREAAAQFDEWKMRQPRRVKPHYESLHDAWLAALFSESPEVEWQDLRQLQGFASQLSNWRRTLDLTARARVRLCFRLEEPEDKKTKEKQNAAAGKRHGAKWRVRYLLQPHADPSLLLDMGKIWRPLSHEMSVLRKMAGDVTEYLLAALGQASGLSAAVAKSLEKKNPAGYTLSTEEAYNFLTREAPMFENAGFGVFLPSWWIGTGTKQCLRAQARVKSPQMQGKSGLTMNAIASVDWELALGDEALSQEELEQLASLKAPLVRLRGNWVELNPEQIKKAATFLKEGQNIDLPIGDIVRLALGAGEGPAGLLVAGVEADGWIKNVLNNLRDSAFFEQAACPVSFKGQLRPYQERGLSWLAFLRRFSLGACLADDMGLGKTIQALALVAMEQEAGEKRPVLLVCPTSVINNWVRETQRFTPDISVMVHHGISRPRRKVFVRESTRHSLVISSYGLLHRDLAFLRDVSWAGVILDEAQNIKNPETKQSRAARSLAADYRIVLTGTPVENNIGDLWSLMEFLNPGLLGSQRAFKMRFFLPIQTRSDKEAVALLKRITGPFILRRLKTDKAIIDDLPEKLEMKVWCTMTREQATLYAAVVKETERALEESDGIQRKGLILATISKLKQVCNHPAQFLGDGSSSEGRSGKLARLVEMLEEVLASNEKALIFTQFAEMGTILKRHLEETFGREALFLHGRVVKSQRDRMVERFQDDAEGPGIFILTVKAGGTGLNLTQACHVFHFDRWWNPAVENQATDRAFRIGQKKNVQVHKFICAGTLEERIDEMIEKKTAVSAAVIGEGEGWLTELSNEELKRVFAMGKEAVQD
jgi:SNF2 family DNA or RNA helicase